MMKPVIYLDNSATTRVYPEVVQAMTEMMETDFGNPSSLHRMGLAAEKRMNRAREQVAKAFSAKPKEIVFTSGGTEANNMAIRGVAYQYRNRGNHLITTSIEHPSVLQTFRRLESEGFQVTYISVDSEGLVRLDELQAALTPGTILVSVMHVNNELGAVQPVEEIGALIKDRGQRTVFHVDAIQSFGKFPISPQRMRIDLLTISGHKIHGPKGIGALYINEKIQVPPLIEGGGQERDLRSGTENIPGIVGLGLAAERIESERPQQIVRLRALKAWFLEELQKAIPDVKINGPHSAGTLEAGRSAPHIVNLSFPGLKGEVLLHALEDYQIYVSTGSACHSRQSGPSHVLQAIGLKPRELESALRFSLSYQTTQEELETVLTHLPGLVKEFRSLMQR